MTQGKVDQQCRGGEDDREPEQNGVADPAPVAQHPGAEQKEEQCRRGVDQHVPQGMRRGLRARQGDW